MCSHTLGDELQREVQDTIKVYTLGSSVSGTHPTPKYADLHAQAFSTQPAIKESQVVPSREEKGKHAVSM